MGDLINFTTADGNAARGYLATPATGTGPGVLVIQEWWGLVDHIKEVCDRFAEAGWVALAPDLYDGREVPLDEPDEAAKAMMGMQLSRAAADLDGAVDVLVARSAGHGVGVIGFCMGGGLALVVGANRPDAVAAVVSCYGVLPWPEAHPDYTNLAAATLLQCAGEDDFFTPDAARALASRLEDLGKVVELAIYDGAQHAFFNDDRPEVYDPTAAQALWERSLDFLSAHVGTSAG